MLWLVWSSGNGVGHIDEVKLLRVRLILGLARTFDRSSIANPSTDRTRRSLTLLT